MQVGVLCCYDLIVFGGKSIPSNFLSVVFSAFAYFYIHPTVSKRSIFADGIE